MIGTNTINNILFLVSVGFLWNTDAVIKPKKRIHPIKWLERVEFFNAYLQDLDNCLWNGLLRSSLRNLIYCATHPSTRPEKHSFGV